MVAVEALAAALLLQAATPAAPALQRTWLLDCDVGTAQAPAVRVFRIGPRLLQEWKPQEKKFGSNLCLGYSCKVAPNRLEGRVSSASVTLMIRIDPATKKASWATVGASGLKRTSGPCATRPDPTGATKG